MRPVGWSSSTSSSTGLRDRCSVSTVASVADVVSEKPRTVSLTKDENGYGFYLKKHKTSPMHIISDVEDGSQALRAGLRNGDILGCVNGVDVMHDTHEEVVQKIKNSGDQVELTLASQGVMEMFYQHGISTTFDDRESWMCLDDATFSYTNAAFEDPPQIQTHFSSVHHNLQKDSSSVFGEVNGNLPNFFFTKGQELPSADNEEYLKSRAIIKSTDSSILTESSSSPSQRTCKLVKSENGYGFQLDHNFDTNIHSISAVTSGSPADKAGLREGDKVMEVNGVSTVDKSHQEVLEIIKTHESEVTFIVITDEERWKNMEIKAKAKEGFYRKIFSYTSSVHECLLVKKPEEEFEFFLMVDTARNAQVITDIVAGGPADRCGLKNGDTLIEVNGINVENKPHKQVVQLIKENVANNQIKFLVTGEKRSLYDAKRKDSCVIS